MLRCNKEWYEQVGGASEVLFVDVRALSVWVGDSESDQWKKSRESWAVKTVTQKVPQKRCKGTCCAKTIVKIINFYEQNQV